jgi:hypothetical protein
MGDYKGPYDSYLSVNSDLGSSVAQNGSVFTVNYRPSLSLPRNPKNVSVAFVQGTFWWTIPNFQTCQIQLFVQDEKKVEVNIPLTIPKGLYNYKQINTLMGNAFQDRGFARNSIEFVENGATSTIDISFAIIGAVLFPQGSCEKQFGYDADVRYQFTGAGDYVSKFVRAPHVASFDTIQYLTVGCSLVNGGFRLNSGEFKSVIANVTINAAPGYQITAEPANPLEIPTNVFESGNGLERVTFSLMDQDGNAVDTNGEAWTLLLRIRYYL